MLSFRLKVSLHSLNAKAHRVLSVGLVFRWWVFVRVGSYSSPWAACGVFWVGLCRRVRSIMLTRSSQGAAIHRGGVMFLVFMCEPIASAMEAMLIVMISAQVSALLIGSPCAGFLIAHV